MLEDQKTETEKRNAALASVEYIRDGMRVGLGTGSTVKYLLDELAARVGKGLSIQCVATSLETEESARRLGIPVKELVELRELDIAIDGADQFDENKNLIKGGHGALLREKVIAAAAAVFVVIADSSKRAAMLNAPVPVEFVPFAIPVVHALIEKLHGEAKLRCGAGEDPFLTQQGNYIFDAHFGEIADPEGLGDRISRIPGVAGHGLFCEMAQHIIVGNGNSLEIIRQVGFR